MSKSLEESSRSALEAQKRGLEEDIEVLNGRMTLLQTHLREISTQRRKARRALKAVRRRGSQAEITAAEAVLAALTPTPHTMADMKRVKDTRKALSAELKKVVSAIEYEKSKLTLEGVHESQYPAYAAALAGTLEAELRPFDGKIVADPDGTYASTWFSKAPPRTETGGFSCADRVKSALGMEGDTDFVSEVPLGFDPESEDSDDSAAAAAAGSADGGARPKPLNRKLFEWFFCMIHCGFEPRSATDMDHVIPYEIVRSHQQRLLDFLNENIDFANHLVDIEGMEKYFRIQTIDGSPRVQISKYFCARGYNAIGNLWLLCHVCNLYKSASYPLAFLAKKKAFGPDFIKAVTKAGSLHLGVLTGRIFHLPGVKGSPGTPPLSLKTKGGLRIHLYTGIGEELGCFIQNWFTRHRRGIYDAASLFEGEVVESFRRELSEILRLRDRQEAQVRTRQCRNTLRILAGVYKRKIGLPGSVSDSGSENTESREFRDILPSKVADFMTHLEISATYIKKIGKLLRVHFPDRKREIWEPMGAYLLSEGEHTSHGDLNYLHGRVALILRGVIDLERAEDEISTFFQQFIASRKAARAAKAALESSMPTPTGSSRSSSIGGDVGDPSAREMDSLWDDFLGRADSLAEEGESGADSSVGVPILKATTQLVEISRRLQNQAMSVTSSNVPDEAITSLLECLARLTSLSERMPVSDSLGHSKIPPTKDGGAAGIPFGR